MRELLTAIIREDECIGCSRCIAVCPVDAIIGTHKFLHSVLLDECIGCNLCVVACPVDCIDMVPLATCLPADIAIDKPARALKAKQRHRARMLRLEQAAQRMLPVYASAQERRAQMQEEIQAAVARARSKQQGTA